MPRRIKTGLAEKVLKGDVQAAARLISLIEDRAPEAFAELDRLYSHGGRAHIVGITGPPGAGKSTLIDALIGRYRRQERTVGVIAIDPTSDRTGGALLGDRVRMQRHSADPRVFIRSLATRGWEGGLARAAISTVRVVDALGSDIIMLETVGSGQVELDIVRVAETTVLVMAPGAGDEVQAMKAGILEAADIIVVNKADKEGAECLKADLEACQAPAGLAAWRPPVLLAEAVNDKGTAELVAVITRHHEFLEAGGELSRRRRERVRLELLGVVEGSVRDSLRELENSGGLDKLVDDLLEGRKTPRAAAAEIFTQLKNRYFDSPP